MVTLEVSGRKSAKQTKPLLKKSAERRRKRKSKNKGKKRSKSSSAMMLELRLVQVHLLRRLAVPLHQVKVKSQQMKSLSANRRRSSKRLKKKRGTRTSVMQKRSKLSLKK